MISSVPIHLYTMKDYRYIVGTVRDVEPHESDNISNIVSRQVLDWLYSDDICGAVTTHASSSSCNSIHWNYTHYFSISFTSKLFQLLFPSISILLMLSFNAATPQVNFRGIDGMYIPHHCSNVVDWIMTMIDSINGLTQSCNLFHFATLWIPILYTLWPVPDKYRTCFQHLATDWTYQLSSCNSASYGDCISATRVYFKIFRIYDEAHAPNAVPAITPISSYGLHIDI